MLRRKEKRAVGRKAAADGSAVKLLWHGHACVYVYLVHKSITYIFSQSLLQY